MESESEVNRVDAESVVVLYNKDSGEIKHIHREVTFLGGRHPDQEEQERRATDAASRVGLHDITKLALLHVDTQRLKPDVRYKVDVDRQQLVEAPETQ